MSDSDDRASMELDADAWHQDEDGNHYIDCPECGSPATLSNVVNHGRCNAFIDEREGTDPEGAEVSCTASLSLELRYTSKPPGDSERETADDPEEQGEGVDIDDQASGTEGAPSN